jgi:hypothetical protein
MPDRLRELGPFWSQVLVWIGLLAPPLFGAMIYDSRYSQGLTLRERGVNWMIAAGLGSVGGGVCGEIWTLGPYTTAIISIGFAFAGNDLVTIARAFLRPFKEDPLGAFKGWIGAWFNRGQQ